jgi:hypothetical protein
MRLNKVQNIKNLFRPHYYNLQNLIARQKSKIIKNENLVNYFIVGAQKSGTTYLHDLMLTNLNFGASLRKEIHYFDWYFKNDENFYHNFWSKGVTNRLDSSPSYLFNSDVAKRIKLYNPLANIIVVIRNPVSRFVSHYFHNKRLGIENRDICDVLVSSIEVYKKAIDSSDLSEFLKTVKETDSYLLRGCYSFQLKIYFDLFKDIRLYTDKYVYKNEERIILDLETDYLKLISDNFQTIPPSNVNKVKESVSSEIIEKLNDLYSIPNENLIEFMKTYKINKEIIEYVEKW